MKDLITYLADRRASLFHTPGNAAAAEIKLLRRSLDLLQGLESVLNEFPGLVDGEQDVNGSDLVQRMSLWVAEHLRSV